MSVNVRQERFVQNLAAKSMNATAAYKAAGYKGLGRGWRERPAYRVRLGHLAFPDGRLISIPVFGFRRRPVAATI